MVDRRDRTTEPHRSKLAALSTRQALVIAGLALGLAGVTVNSAIGLASARTATPVHLRCAGGLVVGFQPEHDSSVQTRSPQEQAQRILGGSVGGQPLLGRTGLSQQITYQNGRLQQITMRDSNDTRQAILTYRNEGKLGWRLDGLERCP